MRRAIKLGAALVLVSLLLWAVVASKIDMTRGTTPGNPSATKLRFWANDSTAKMECLDSAGANCIGPPAGLSITAGKTLSVSNTLTLAGTDSTTMTFPTTSATVARTDAANTFTGHQTFEGVTSTGATGTGKFVFDGTPTLVTPVIGATTGTSLLVTGIVDGQAPITVATGNVSPGTTYNTGYVFNEHATAGTGITVTLPTAAAGKQYCVSNAYNGSAANTGVLTVATSASGPFIIFTDGTLTATGGNVTSGGAARDAACFVGVDSTHWAQYTQAGTWTKH